MADALQEPEHQGSMLDAYGTFDEVDMLSLAMDHIPDIYHEHKNVQPKQEPLSPAASFEKEYCTLQPVKREENMDAFQMENDFSFGMKMIRNIASSHNFQPSSVAMETGAMELDSVTPTIEPMNLKSWSEILPSNWTNREVMSFVHWVAEEMNFGSTFCGERFQNIDGKMLMQMSPDEFCERDQNCGLHIYDVFKVLEAEEPQDYFDDLGFVESPVVPKTISESVFNSPPRSSSEDGYGSAASDDIEPSMLPKPLIEKEDGGKEKMKRTRRRGSGQRAGPHLWEFVRNLLLDEKYNKIISWENRQEGIFRIVHSEAVAKLWGRQKHNTKMSYEKLSRALRFSREANYFEKLPVNNRYPKKLCFKFGARSFGWQL